MGLIANPEYTQAGVPVVTTYTQHIPTKVCTDGSSSSPYEETLSFDKTIYRIFSKQDDMKTLVYPIKVRSEFDLFLQYAETKTLGNVDANFDVLDTYLGTIGIAIEYCDKEQ